MHWHWTLLFFPRAFLAKERSAHSVAGDRPVYPAAAGAAQTPGNPQVPRGEPPQPPRDRRSYERETNSRRRSRISKQEVAFMKAIAGTCMGVGAIAGGAKGLAIGSIVGGWGACAAHRLWLWIR